MSRTPARHRGWASSEARRPQASPVESLDFTKVERLRSGALFWEAFFWVNLVAVLSFYAVQQDVAALASRLGVASLVNHVSALVATYLCIVQVILLCRIPIVERYFGTDRLIVWHREFGHVIGLLVVAHVIFATIKHAMLVQRGIWDQFVTFLQTERDYLFALGALLCFGAVIITSVRKAQRRMRYETWYFVHLYAYLGVALVVPHQFFQGTTVAASSLAQGHWVALYVVLVGAILYRGINPFVVFFRHDLRVAGLTRETPEAISIVIEGKNLDRLGAIAGQFFYWRFLTRNQWWQSHPYSLSAVPTDREFRITVKDLGDGSRSLMDLPIGTRVSAEGPLGHLTQRWRSRRKILFVAAGVGVAPIRSLVEEFQAKRNDLVLLYRVRNREDVLFAEELKELERRKGMRLFIVLGQTSDYRKEYPPVSPERIRELVPDVAQREVFMCGPYRFSEAVQESLLELGCAEEQIHVEAFGA